MSQSPLTPVVLSGPGAPTTLTAVPDPTTHRGQYLIPLEMEDADWLSFLGVSYYIEPTASAAAGQVSVRLVVENTDKHFTCGVYNEVGAMVQALDVAANSNGRGTTTGVPLTITDHFHDTSITFRFNYQGSVGVRDLPLTLDFGDALIPTLAWHTIVFTLAPRPVSSTSLQAAQRRQAAAVPGGATATPMIYLHGYEDPNTGYETPATRVPPIAMTPSRIAAAWQTAKDTGYFDPEVFPNVPAGQDEATRAGIRAAVAPLDPATVIKHLLSGARLSVQQDASGRYSYRFLPMPEHCEPGLVLVEHYRLTSFPARYGPGRVINTFSLLPGEQTTIRVNTYKRSTETIQQASSILDATNDETETAFSQSVNAESSSQDNSSKTFEYRAEAEAEGQATWGWGSARAKVSGGVSGSSNSAREEFAKNMSNAVNQNAAKAASRREIQVDTSKDMKLEQGEEQATDRTLQNINVSRTLNFVFRQMNQEYVSLLHLVDVRIGFFNGHAESRDEAPLSDLERLLDACVRPERIDAVRNRILSQLQSIKDYRGEAQAGFVEVVQEDGALPWARVAPDFTSGYTDPDGESFQVPGIIIAADQQVIRTDGVLIESFLGEGNGLDTYSLGLQEQAVRSRDAANQLQELQAERLRLALKIIGDNDAERLALYQRIFVTPQIVNQIDHAAVSTANPDTTGASALTNGALNVTAPGASVAW